MAAIRSSSSVDSDQTFPLLSKSMEYPTRGYSTLNQKRHSIRHSTSILEDAVSIEHVNSFPLMSMSSKVVVAFSMILFLCVLLPTRLQIRCKRVNFEKTCMQYIILFHTSHFVIRHEITCGLKHFI